MTRFLPYLPLVGAVVIALLVAGEEDSPRRQELIGWAAALVGLTMAWLGAQAVARGEVLVRSRKARRRENPTNFWVTVILFRFGIAALFFAAAYRYLA